MKRIVVFTGAGISKASGIPTFQDMEGVRDKLEINYFRENPAEVYKALFDMKYRIERAAPNPAHMAIAEYNLPVVTMNIDGLHLRAGSKQLVEIHGNLEHVICTKCKKEFEFQQAEKSIYCSSCNGLLRPDIVLYGEMIPKYLDAIELIESAEELLVVGTSFYTSTATELVSRAKWIGAKVKIINENAETEVPIYLREQLYLRKKRY